ncbi:MAG: 1,4-alpha-glucan branching protein GlgB [Gammaproteobacteria bacterium]|nr:1,4-alpha-glucan branching protein GlgB [Gammaproteobacteria bacterium]
MSHSVHTAHQTPATLPGDLQKIAEARHHEPFTVLGRHIEGDRALIRAYIPGAAAVFLAETGQPLVRITGSDFFEWRGTRAETAERYQLHWSDASGHAHTAYDPYCFPPQLSHFDLGLFSEGKHWHAYRFLGAHPHVADSVHGILFSTWAPNAGRVSVVGDFNHWDGRRHPMHTRGDSGVWELFIPGVQEGALYKFEIRNRDSGTIHLKVDPYAQRSEVRPGTASIVVAERDYAWSDEAWLKARASSDWLHQPMSIYEVHLGSWQRDEYGNFLNYRELAHRLVDHVKRTGFTHIELLPITEHPLDASWGYQTIGYYAATSRFGTPDDFRYFVDHCHQHGIGVLLDWVPGHFPKDLHGLARFDGTALYEHEDPRRGEHRDWGTLIFNYGRNEVKNFLMSNALFWLEEFHLDGLRVDAVASILYLDYSREPGDWLPNAYGGNENLEAIDFLRAVNNLTHELHPGTVIIAEESTAWPMVSRPAYLGGLGFSMKWNMGWMHDTLQYMSKDPVHRHYHHDHLTFGLLYAFTENFVLPFSHDEVVHGKQSMLNKMPGDEWQKFANLRLLYTYMFTYPGKKLLFMGCEFGQGNEWDHASPLDWWVLDYPLHQGMQTLIGDLNQLYRTVPALHQHDFDHHGFEWIDCHDATQSVLSYVRKDGDGFVLVALNFTPMPRHNYRIGVPAEGWYQEILNSDSSYYGGSNTGNFNAVHSEPQPWMGRPWSIQITLPPLAAVVFRLSKG